MPEITAIYILRGIGKGNKISAWKSHNLRRYVYLAVIGKESKNSLHRKATIYSGMYAWRALEKGIKSLHENFDKGVTPIIPLNE